MIILGISCEHDSGAALIVDGKHVAACNEERFSRKKFATAFPSQSIEYVLQTAKIAPSAIDQVVLASQMHVPEFRLDWKAKVKPLDGALWLTEKTNTVRLILGTDTGNALAFHTLKNFFNRTRTSNLEKNIPKSGINYPKSVVNHHLCHAYGAVAGSGFEECLVLTLDGSGDALCSVFGHYSKKTGLKILSRVPMFHSPGHYYLYMTHLFGYAMGREGKLTGMAALGDASKTKTIFDTRMGYNDRECRFENFGSYRDPEIAFLKNAFKEFSKEDIAAGLQQNLEDVVLRHIKALTKKFGYTNLPLALSGGVFANVRLNQLVSELDFIPEIFVYPHMGDGGLPAGAALEHFFKSTRQFHKLDEVYLGPDAPKLTPLDESTHSDLTFEHFSDSDFTIAAATDLANQQTVALVRGAMEYGPRALGNRSLLYDAREAEVNDWLNKKLSRSEFMPFAPILKEEHVEK